MLATTRESEKPPADLLKIGELARRVGVTLRTIRYYQSLGLIEAAQRTPGGLHLYGTEACDRIRLIRDLRSLDVPLGRIRGILEQRRAAGTGADASRDVVALLGRGLADVEKRVQQYLGLRREMGEALEVLEMCLRCSKAPSRAVCLACDNLTRRERIPMYVRALVN